MMETAYYAAVVPHMKNPPKLKDLLNPTDAPRRKQSWEQMKAALAIALG